jgi:hypothetical protein
MTNEGGNGSPFSIFQEKTIPDIYADSARFDLTAYGVTLEFGQTRPAPGPGHQPSHIPQMRVSMSPQHAKVVALLLRKTLQAYEQQVGRLALPPELLAELGIAEEWDE